jgi:hypothetical protein
VFKARGAGAIGLILAGLASIGWAVALWYVVRPLQADGVSAGAPEPIWAAATLVSAVFTLVGGLLYAGDHPDARVVGFFGALIFAIPNLLVAFTSLVDRLGARDLCTGSFFDKCSAKGVLDGNAVVLLLTGAAALTLLQLVILLFAAPKRKGEQVAAAL